LARFTDDFIRRVREASDIVQVVESYGIPLRRAGTNCVALCPFHSEKTPSFNVNPADQFFKCFGCDEKGDVIAFVQKFERVEFAEAVETLAARAGIPLEVADRAHRERDAREAEARKSLRWINQKALEYFEERLAEVRDGQRGRAYLLGRGFTEQTIAAWRLGWAPDRWDALREYLVGLAGEHKREKILDAGVAAGVLRRRDGGEAYDAFRGRVIFPIFDIQNRPVGFGGRVLEEKPEAGGKYINTAEGALFQKRTLLYGLSFASKEIGLTRTAIVVEGYTDTIMAHQYGLRNVVATLGTSLTQEHVQRLRRYVHDGGRVIALFDADEAGERATERAARLFMEEDVPLHIVRNLELKDACAFLPQFGGERFREEIEKAEDSFRWVLRRTRERAGCTVGQQSAAAHTVMEVVNRSPNAVARAMMRKEVAAAFQIPEETLPQPVARTKPGATASGRPRGLTLTPGGRPAVAAPRGGRHRRELRLLQYMLESGAWCAHVVERVPPDDFQDAACAEVAGRLREAWERGVRPEIAELRRECVRENAGRIIDDLAVASRELVCSDEDLEDVLRSFDVERLRQEEGAIMSALRAAQQEGDADRADALSLRKIQIAREVRSLGREAARSHDGS